VASTSWDFKPWRERCLREGDASKWGSTVATYTELIKLAESVLDAASEGEDIDRLITQLEAYGQAFDSWQLENLQPHAMPSEEQLKRLDGFHCRVLAVAKELQERTGDELLALGNRGRGLRRYIDQLPSRISRTTSKKG